MHSQLFLLILSALQVDGFVYSCDEVKYRLTDTDFKWNTRYAYVIMDAVFGTFTAHSYVIVIPEVGMWLNKLSMAGEGNFTVYTGAGRGEDEERYEMKSWSCESMPDWIFYLGSVLTIEADESCSFLFAYSSNLEREVTVYRHDRVAVLLSGLSDDIQNNYYSYTMAKVQIGDEEPSNTTWNMQISLDSANKAGYLSILDGRVGNSWGYNTGTYTEEIFTDYFEVSWHPTKLKSQDIWKNNDFVYVEIQVSPWNEDFMCREGYAQVTSVDGQQWCYMIVWPIPPTVGFNFSKSVQTCAESEGWLPIITSDDMETSMQSFVNMHLGIDNIWLGLICDPETDSLMWQDGQEMVYNAFYNSSRVLESGHNCSTESVNYGLEFSITTQDGAHFLNFWRPYAPDREFACAVCVTSGHRLDFQVHQFQRQLQFQGNQLTMNSNPGMHILDIKPSACLGYYSDCDIVYSHHSVLCWNNHDFPTKNTITTGESCGGHVLAKNIPLGVGRSIAELSALTNNNDSVAVKMLHENADAQRENEFLAEIDLMKKIGYHERLVNMLACVTSSKPVLLICEYCTNGDLLEYLRNKRKFMLENPEVINSAEIITVKRQLMFAIQIAYGMEFLSTQGFIHRDLAARNIMVDHQESCKIGDFGLARSLGVENENYQAQGGKLPLKWMSPEAIDKYFFSSATDVWSFGVLLYEIVTLGGSPYAGWPATQILSRLKSGERMEKPDNCSDNLYDLMLACWSEQLADRPTFSDLREHLGHLLEDINQDDYYLKLNPRAHYYVLESNASSE
ncbi:hypothetical protein PRIPAC_77747 [Pristionchus pacificus]|uniref:Protein kinase domain-containing protein n=1 Tax=Pristionchus pacificus TaxID=54126 RepID=A0A2A6BI57_PRIPA|nr:hypothetical protein PRIPAC_77747 [Pristionchus pacificus]|eukprot:PDM65584.1 protein kinase [Pristionchus pacificus]